MISFDDNEPDDSESLHEDARTKTLELLFTEFVSVLNMKGYLDKEIGGMLHTAVFAMFYKIMAEQHGILPDHVLTQTFTSMSQEVAIYSIKQLRGLE